MKFILPHVICPNCMQPMRAAERVKRGAKQGKFYCATVGCYSENVLWTFDLPLALEGVITGSAEGFLE